MPKLGVAPTPQDSERVLDLRSLSKSELLELKLNLQESVDSIKRQLAEAKSNAYLTGVYSDRDWFRGATYALNAKKRQIQGIQNRLSALREEKDKKVWSRRFVGVARELLTPEEFAVLEEETDRVMGVKTP